MKRPSPDTIIFDFDNTLYDWVSQWYFSFNAMLQEIHRISGVPLDRLKKDIRLVHQQHHTSEYAFLIENLDVIRSGSKEATLSKYQPAIEAYKTERSKHLRLYPSALETLHQLKTLGKTLAVFTESQTFYTVMRFKYFGLEGLIDFLFTSDDHDKPEEEYLDRIRSHPSAFYEIKSTKHRSVGKGRVKPDPAILSGIISEVGANEATTLYVGDSLYKDVLMANEAKILGVWAKYGEARNQSGYDLLREVSHWTDDDVERDKVLKLQDVKPDFVLRNSVSDLLSIVESDQHV